MLADGAAEAAAGEPKAAEKPAETAEEKPAAAASTEAAADQKEVKRDRSRERSRSRSRFVDVGYVVFLPLHAPCRVNHLGTAGSLLLSVSGGWCARLLSCSMLMLHACICWLQGPS